MMTAWVTAPACVNANLACQLHPLRRVILLVLLVTTASIYFMKTSYNYNTKTVAYHSEYFHSLSKHDKSLIEVSQMSKDVLSLAQYENNQQIKDEEQELLQQTLPNYYIPITELDKQKHWELRFLNNGEKVECRIHTTSSTLLPDNNVSDIKSFKRSNYQSSVRSKDKNQYLIHIHGLHHTGTGFLRKTLFQALNNEFGTDADSPVASMHDSFLPFQHLSIESSNESSQYYVPENEGQHFQNIYPSYRHRLQKFTQGKGTWKNAGVLAYIADLCNIMGDYSNSSALNIKDVRHDSDNKKIGNILMNEWSNYWNTSATYLLQKTPMLDVSFLESIKVLPTFHVIIVRHPMTSNSWRFHWMALTWLDIWSHTLDLLAKNKIEWYALVTYEALVQNQEQVVEELIEVIRSGMERFGPKKRNQAKNTSSLELLHRRLPMHNVSTFKDEKNSYNSSLSSYLIPQNGSITLWKKCLNVQLCQMLLDEMTTDIFPFFGYESMSWTTVNEESKQDKNLFAPLDIDRGEDCTDFTTSIMRKKDKELTSSSLTSYPAPISVSRDFGHVLFSSESNALNILKNRYIGNEGENISISARKCITGCHPLLEMIFKMKQILSSYQEAISKSEPFKSVKEKYWKLKLSDDGDNVNCEISTKPFTPSHSKIEKNNLKETATNDTKVISGLSSSKIDKEQYAIHIHGLHHTGTGYLRQTLNDALNMIYPYSASMHDSSFGSKRTGRVNKAQDMKCNVPENEGQHLQSIYPSFQERAREFIQMKINGSKLGKLAYTADFCSISGKDASNKVGTLLLQQWSQYWNMSATFLLQKTPTLDVLFHESTKTLPTLHVLIIRHPMTSNSWGIFSMCFGWLDAWTHTLDLLAQDKIEWYAVITYEALVQYHDTIMEELIEVVHSGMKRFGTDTLRGNGKISEKNCSTGCDMYGLIPSHHRLLEFHAVDSFPTLSNATVSSNISSSKSMSYLVPSNRSIILWEKCLAISQCHNLMNQLNDNIFPFFGYENATKMSSKTNPSSASRAITVSKEYGHILFSSEGSTLDQFRQSRRTDASMETGHKIGYQPSEALLFKMKDILRKNAKFVSNIRYKNQTSL